MRVRRVGDHHEAILGEPVDDQVVEDAAVGRADHRVLGAADGQRRWVRHEGKSQCLTGVRPLHEQLAHVREVEQPGSLSDRSMLVEDRAVLHRHPPAGEVDHPGAQRLMAVGQWCLVDDGSGPPRVGHEARSAGVPMSSAA